MTEEAKTEGKAEPKRKRHPILLDAFLILSFLIIVLLSASYWYISQPEARQKAICEDTGTWVDKGARPLGELVARIVEQFKFEPEDPVEKE